MPCYAVDGQAPAIAPDAWVAPSADLIGDVRLAARASVWFGSAIRADNTPIEIGEGSNVQEGCVLHSDPGAPLTIGRGVTIGHRAVLHGCTIADDVLIGMGAILLNRATIASDCIVGAGALVTEGKSFPPGSLIIGAPAKAVRALSAEEIASIRVSARHYAERQGHYATALHPIAPRSGDC